MDINVKSNGHRELSNFLCKDSYSICFGSANGAGTKTSGKGIGYGNASGSDGIIGSARAGWSVGSGIYTVI